MQIWLEYFKKAQPHLLVSRELRMQQRVERANQKTIEALWKSWCSLPSLGVKSDKASLFNNNVVVEKKEEEKYLVASKCWQNLNLLQFPSMSHQTLIYDHEKKWTLATKRLSYVISLLFTPQKGIQSSNFKIYRVHTTSYDTLAPFILNVVILHPTIGLNPFWSHIQAPKSLWFREKINCLFSGVGSKVRLHFVKL